MTQQSAPGGAYQPPTDGGFMGAAAATGAASSANINDQTVQNRSNQVAPDGSTLNWTQDPNTHQWTQTITQGAGGQALTAGANALAPQAVSSLSQPVSTEGLTDLFSLNGKTPGGFNDAAYQAIMSRVNPELDRRRAAADTQLANQGITRGSEAWTGQQDQLGRDENDAIQQSILSGFKQGSLDQSMAIDMATATGQQREGQFKERLGLRAQPLQDYLSLQGGVKDPKFGQYTTAGSAQAPNFLGAAQSSYNAELDKLNLSADQRAGLTNGLFSLGGSFLQSPTGQKLADTGLNWASGLFGFGG